VVDVVIKQSSFVVTKNVTRILDLFLVSRFGNHALLEKPTSQIETSHVCL
jgi:hypothetical protein